MIRKPPWLRPEFPTSPEFHALRGLFRRQQLHTVCQEAACPNQGRCWREGSAAFLILGDRCTRSCAFCNVQTGRPGPPDPEEPQRLAATAAQLGLRHVVITSVTRDDLPDGGAAQFAACVTALRTQLPGAAIELLTPDFRHQPDALATLLKARPEVFNHNVETVPRLYPTVRPGGDYAHSLALLAEAKRQGGPGLLTKSGLMMGLGEEEEEAQRVIADLADHGVSLLTIGQYLQPTRQHHPVVRFWPPEAFDALKRHALALGFRAVESHPLARSSFGAGVTYQEAHHG